MEHEAWQNLEAWKAHWRSEMRRRLAALSPEIRRAESFRICEHVRQSQPWQEARVVLLYAPLDVEPDLTSLWVAAFDSGKVVALPRYDPVLGEYLPARITHPQQDLAPGRYGVLEPRAELPAWSWGDLDLLIVPGLAFDRAGRRLGRGKGHYDRMLARAAGFRCGVAFRCQIVETVPAGAHDARVHAVVTAGGWMDTR